MYEDYQHTIRMEIDSEKEQKELAQVISLVHSNDVVDFGVDQIKWNTKVNKLIESIENEVTPQFKFPDRAVGSY